MATLFSKSPVADQHAKTAFDHADKAIASLTNAHTSAVEEMATIESQIAALEDRRAELTVRRDNIGRVIESLDNSLFFQMIQGEVYSTTKTPFDFVPPTKPVKPIDPSADPIGPTPEVRLYTDATMTKEL